VTSDNALPVATLIRPVDGSMYPAGASLSLEARGSDTNGSIAKIEIWQRSAYYGTTRIASSIGAAPLLHTYTLPYGDTTMSFYAIVEDNLGARTQSAMSTVTITTITDDPRFFVWQNFNAALKAQNKTVALEYLSPTAQENYAGAIDAIMPQVASAAATPPSNLLRINASDTAADYLVARTVDSVRRVFGVSFIKMEDGAWKIDAF
jgi:hypothetical protein